MCPPVLTFSHKLSQFILLIAHGFLQLGQEITHGHWLNDAGHSGDIVGSENPVWGNHGMHETWAQAAT